MKGKKKLIAEENCRDWLAGLDCPYLNKYGTMKPFGEYVLDHLSGRMVYHVRNLPLFIQAVGSVKYNLARNDKREESGIRVFYRGQNSLHEVDAPFLPNAYRKAGGSFPRHANVDARIDAQVKILQENSENMANLDKKVVEGVLQHYGLKSRWFDAVDNVWTALWFACHKAVCGNKNQECIHYERRDPKVEKAAFRYCYILLLGVDTTGMRSNGIPGFIGNGKGEVLDLRYALPSFYIRPHIQHGVLVRLLDGSGKPKYDMSGLLRSVIRIDLSVALQWLGKGLHLDTLDMFPPPAYDTGLDELFRTELKIDKEIARLENLVDLYHSDKMKLSRYQKNRIVLQRVC